MKKEGISLAEFVYRYSYSHIHIHTYLWLEYLAWRAREIWYEWQNLIFFFSQLLEAFVMQKPWGDAGWFSISFKACSQNCCNDMGECWFLLNTLQIRTACSVPGKMPLWRDITAELPENSSVMGRGRRKEGRHKEQYIPTATHEDRLLVRYESATTKEVLMPKGNYVRIWDK